MRSKKQKDSTPVLNDYWDLDASASDNESYELERAQDDTIQIHNQVKQNMKQ